ncbi:MAG: transposase [Oscillospiraceae bacterium]|nr:transposase [Oscillospiraceae bacterium]
MKYIEKESREQLTLLPDCIEDYISENNPVRIIDAFVDSLDMYRLGFLRAVPGETGRPPYDPRDLLKLYIYGYFNRIRSSRRLMLECRRNVELFYLLGKLTPDFRTIADFRKDNGAAIRGVFREFVKLCVKLNMYERELLAVDGSKVRAANSDDNAYNAEILEKKLARIDGHIREYLSQLDRQDQDALEESEMTAEQIRSAISTLRERKERYEGYLAELGESGETQLLTTDPEARRMHSKDGFHCCYNVQTAVDSGSHLIAEYEVTNRNTDQGLLCRVVTGAKENLGTEVIETVADKGYESREDILNCVMNGIIPTVALKYDKYERLFQIPYEDVTITQDMRSSTRPDDIQACISAGILPDCYTGSNIEVAVQRKTELSCFIRDENGAVTCPTGETLSLVKTKGSNSIYANKDACRQCQTRCVSGKWFKRVSFGPHTKVVPTWVYGTPEKPLTKIPDDIPANPYNHTLNRTDYSKPKKVVVRIRMDKEKLKKRMCLSEHPFGTVKWWHGAHYVLCKGIEKATAELGLSFLAYNLRRAINIVGTERLIEAMRG